MKKPSREPQYFTQPIIRWDEDSDHQQKAVDLLCSLAKGEITDATTLPEQLRFFIEKKISFAVILDLGSSYHFEFEAPENDFDNFLDYCNDEDLDVTGLYDDIELLIFGELNGDHEVFDSYEDVDEELLEQRGMDRDELKEIIESLWE